MWNTLRMWWSGFQERRGEIHALVECDDLGLSQTIFTVKRKVERRLFWDQITAVCAFKRDCFAVDQINLLFSTNDEYKWIQVTENDQGYNKLVRELPRCLPSCLTHDEWFSIVTFPAFVTNRTELYRRVAQAGQSDGEGPANHSV